MRLGPVLGLLPMLGGLAWTFGPELRYFRVPRFEPLLFREDEWSCKLANLAPRSGVIVLAESGHPQVESFDAIRVLYHAPWRERFTTARLAQKVRVEAMVKSNGTDLRNREISFFHHLDAWSPLSGCVQRGGVLDKGYYVIFLKQLPSGEFRLARDILTSVAPLPGNFKGMRPAGATPEDRILSLLFQKAAREDNLQRRRDLFWKAFAWIEAWELEAENVDFWRAQLQDPRSREFACEAGSHVYWWDFACESTRLNPGRLRDAREELRLDADSWRIRTARRYGVVVTAWIERAL